MVINMCIVLQRDVIRGQIFAHLLKHSPVRFSSDASQHNDSVVRLRKYDGICGVFSPMSDHCLNISDVYPTIRFLLPTSLMNYPYCQTLGQYTWMWTPLVDCVLPCPPIPPTGSWEGTGCCPSWTCSSEINLFPWPQNDTIGRVWEWSLRSLQGNIDDQTIRSLGKRMDLMTEIKESSTSMKQNNYVLPCSLPWCISFYFWSWPILPSKWRMRVERLIDTGK